MKVQSMKKYKVWRSTKYEGARRIWVESSYKVL